MTSIAAGLRTAGGDAIALQGVSVIAEVLGGYAQARVRQKYRNDEERPVEAIYTFPLPSDATLTGFTMTCDGRTCTGEVKERDEAFAQYDDAVTAGHGAALLDQERPNVFTASVGNLLPGEETIIEVSYVQKVQADEGTIRWTIPTLVAPRYIPGAAAGDRTAHGTADPTDRVRDADRISPPIGDVAYGVSLDLVFDVGVDVVVESPSHPVVVTREGSLVRVTFASRTVALDRDVVVTARGQGTLPIATCLAHSANKESGEPGVVALTVVPDLLSFGGRPEKNQVVFVVDVSGSMDGDSIEQARAALRLCVRHLREGDRFNVLAFNDRLTPFQGSPVPFTQATLGQVDAWIAGLRADGGTEMLAPLLEAARQAPSGVVVLLTDGQVGNEDEILAAVLAARGSARFYPFGIGTNVSDALLRGLAKRTGGALEMIHPGERLDEKVIAQFARATAARVSDVTLSFDGVDVGELAPSELPPLVDGEPWTVLGRFEHAGVGRAVVRGMLRGERFALEVPVDLAGSSRPTLAKLWASERIRDLEAAELSGRRAAANKDRIVKLAVLHQVSSKYTSFVVVEKRTGARRSTGVPEARVVPVNAPAGWNMFAKAKKAVPMRSRSYGARLAAPASPSPMRPSPTGAPPPPPAQHAYAAAPMSAMARAMPGQGAIAVGGPASPASRGEAKMDDSFVAFDRLAEIAPEPVPASAPADPIVALLAKQLASGLWDESPFTGDEGVRRLRVTARALATLLDASVTTSHPVHGAQVRKAVEALLVEIAQVAPRAPRIAELALAVAWLVAAGPRTRAAIERLVDSTASLAALKGRLDEASLRADLGALATA